MPRFAFVLKKIPKNSDTINGKIEFTSRERDILACLIEGIPSRKIASTLDIAPKTVRNHVYNITEKLGCHSKNAIIEHMQASENFNDLRNHYQSLSMAADFKDKLNQIKKLVGVHPYVQCIGSPQTEMLERLKQHLECAGVKLWDQSLSIREHPEFIVVILPEYDGNFTSAYMKELIHLPRKEKIFFITQTDIHYSIPQSKNMIYIKNSNYYLLLFEVIKKIHSNIDLKKIIIDFERHWYCNLNFTQKKYAKDIHEVPLIKKSQCFCWKILSIFIFFIFTFLIFFYKKIAISSHYVCADIVIPTEKHFLKRLRLLELIDQKFKEQEGIRTIGLVGIGGAGKTILARQYAKNQKFSLIWELNAKTPGTVLASYFDLAETLTANESEQKRIASIKTIEDCKERHIKIVSFLQEKLKAQKKWLLIFDSAESLADIRKYFPCDDQLWGKGYVLITSQDSQIGHAGYIKPEHVICVDPLTEEEAMTLFINIMDKKILTDADKKNTQFFLNQLPPFPLDISTAAYYIKDTQISFEEYIKQMKSYDQNFDIMQKTVRHAVNDYVLTRDNILQNAFRKILEQHTDFKDLMICIALFDGQSIPKSFLDFYKKRPIVDLFVHMLKTHSLIMYESVYNNEIIFSIHPSTQHGLWNFIQYEYKKDLDKNIANIVDQIECYTNDILSNSDINYLRLFIQHISNIVKNKHIMTNKSLACVYKILGKLYQKIGQFEKSSECFKKTHHTYDKI